MPNVKIVIVVPQEVYSVVQASAAKAELAVPVFVRQVLFNACQITPETANAPSPAPRLTRTKRELLRLLSQHLTTNPASPYLTTSQIAGSLQSCDQSVYIGLRALLRDGLIERGINVQRQGQAGAPLKVYAISEMGSRVLSDELGRVQAVHEAFQKRTQAAHEAYDSLYSPSKPQAPSYTPQQLAAQKGLVHGMLRYIAMAKLGRSIESDADLEATKGVHARLIEAADADVASGAHTYAQIYESVKAKIESLGGEDEISARFN